MATATEGGPTVEELVGILAPTLGDLEAGDRRKALLDGDERTDEELVAVLAPLDELIALFRERLGVSGSIIPLDDVEEVDEVEDVDPTLVVEIATDDEGVTAADAADTDAAVLADAPTRPATASHRRVPTIPDVDAQRKAAELLYEDVLWLFAINDGEGALVSLERLLMLGHLEGEAKEFVDINGDKLLNLYEQVMGPFSKVPSRGDISPNEMPDGYLGKNSLGLVLGLVDGDRTIQDVISSADCPPLHACAALEQLHRARIISL